MTGTILWRNRRLPFRHGDTVATALRRAGVHELGRAATGLERSVFCAIGQCQNCVVLLQGRATEACLLLCDEGMRLEPVPAADSGEYDA